MRLVAIALRNLARNRRRTALSLLVISAGTIALLLTAGFVEFSFDGLREALIHGGLGHLEVVRTDAVAEGESQLDRSLVYGLEAWEPVRDELEKLPGVLAATPTVHVMGMATAGELSASFIGLGVEPDRERTMGFEVRLRSGDDLPAAAPAAGEDVVLLAAGLARSLEVEPGEFVTLLALGPSGMLNALDVQVAGIYSTGMQELDTRFLKLHLATAQRLLETDRVSDLLVGLEETETTAHVAALARERLEDQTPSLSIIDWETRAPFYQQVRNLYLGIFWFLGSIVFVLVVLSTSNTLSMTVMERVQEIGTLRAVGTSRRQIALIFLAEALWLGVLGALVGDLFGWLLIKGINALQLQMPPPPGAVSGIDLQVAVVPAAFGAAVLLMVVVLAVASILPTLRAVRLEIVDALSHV